MLRLLIVLMCLLFSTRSYSQSSFQFLQGKVELGLSGSFGSMFTDSEMKSSSSNSTTKHSDSRTYFQLSLMPAYYFIDGLSFEPELDLFFFEKNKPAFSLIGNASFTVNVGKPNIAAFFKAGYGISNSLKMPLNIGLVNRVSDKMDVPIINLGTGAKICITENVLLRTEINYRILSYSYTNSYKTAFYSYSNTAKYEYTFLTMLVGISVIL